MAKAPVMKSMSIMALKVDKNVNVRLHNNYDLPTIKQSIMDKGRIEDPIHARLCDLVVLRGNRRTLGGQELHEDGTTPNELVKALEKVQVVLHDVVPGSPEELAIILDEGARKGLSKTEILLAVWRQDKQFMSEVQIMNNLYGPLSEYTKNPEKVREIAAAPDLKKRMDILRTWLHGTVGGYMLAASKMGDYVRDQMYKTHLAMDGLLPEGEKLEMRCSRGRITKLSAAKSADDPKNGGKGWTVEAGGENFNATVERFKAEDAGELEAEKGPKRPTVSDLKEKVNAFQSPAIRAALLVAAGEQDKGRELVSLDDKMHRTNLVLEILAKRASTVVDDDLKKLILAIIGDGPVGEVEVLLNKFTTPKAPVQTEQAEPANS